MNLNVKLATAWDSNNSQVGVLHNIYIRSISISVISYRTTLNKSLDIGRIGIVHQVMKINTDIGLHVYL